MTLFRSLFLGTIGEHKMKCTSMLALTVSMFALELSAAQGRLVEGIAVRVGRDIILESEVHQTLQKQLSAQKRSEATDADRTQVLESLIRDKLIRKEARKLSIKIEDAEIENIILRMKDERGLTDMQLNQALLQQGMTLGEYKKTLEKQLLQSKVLQFRVRDRVHIRDEDVDAAMAREAENTVPIKAVRARHILFSAKNHGDEEARALAEKAIERLREEKIPFDELARKISEGPSAPRGGDLGLFERGQMVPAFERAAFGADIERVVGPVKTSFGVHLIWVEEKVEGEGPSVKERRELVRNQLYQVRAEAAFESFMMDLRNKAYVEILPRPK